MLATTCPSSMRSRRLAPPGARTSWRRNSRPENRIARLKTASRKIFSEAPKTHLKNASQTLGTHQENYCWAYDFASGCVVAPNSVDGFDLSAATMPGRGIIGDADKGQAQYLNPADRQKIYTQALGNVNGRVPGLVRAVTDYPQVEIRTNTIFKNGTSLYPEAVYRENGKIIVDLTINGNTSVQFVESMIVHGFTHATQQLSGMRTGNEYDAYRAQYNYEKTYHSSVLPVYGNYVDSAGNFKPEPQFNPAHQARTGQAPNTPVTVAPSALYIVR